ncbi:hypothetical protein [Algoriphagus terrigena]|uniref:hypothetical protein n=1 Tax=Algoriphagus terrigena TaxID=344884 RepID=UPI00047CADCC|nr:hypothetical protein [Algoriphagus terrigena]
MITKTFKSVTLMVFAVGFTAATLASCGAKKEEVIEEETIEEPAPVIEEAPADTTMMDTTAVDTVAA